jgi:hypothetical protein
MAPAVKIPNLAFQNNGNLGFVKRTDWLPQVPSYSYGAAFVDLDNDGDLDYVVNNLDDEAFIYKNSTIEKSKKQSGYLRIKLTGKDGNLMAIGAKTELWCEGKYQFMENFVTRGYASTVDPVVHFGVATGKIIDSVKVSWPTGGKTVIRNVKPDQTLELNESISVAAPISSVPKDNDNLLLAKVENSLDYTHTQEDYVDFELKQTIIPHKFSQIGPRMASGDLNNDGLADLIIGSTNNRPTEVFLRKGNTFTEAKFDGLTTDKDFAESDLAVFDADKDGDNDVVAVAGGYEKSEEQYKHYYYENQDNKFIRHELPVPAFSASVVKACDYNHDGFIDLFIGSRVKREMFPYATHSWLVENVKGKFSVSDKLKLDLGMVTDAIWTDYDNDGWEDLLVIREYNSVLLLKNMQGKEFVPGKIPGIEDKHGIWYSVAAGDFNKDGYTDYIVGNLGANNRYVVSEQYPLNLYTLDLDGNGSIDPVISAYWPDRFNRMREFPLNYLDELWSQSKYFQKFKDYASFSYAYMDDVLSSDILKNLEFKLDVNTTSSYILWNDKGKFIWEKLPDAVQVSPVKKMIVEDLNGDSYPDVIVGGNDYSYDVSTGNYDSNKGLILLNRGKNQEKGRNTFDVLQPSQSGILLQGMVESLLYMKGDTSLVVAGFNRAKAEVFRVK